MTAGVLLTPLQRVAHPKGEVLHALRRSAPGYAGFGEAYFSTVLPQQTKGWKKHTRVTLNLVVPVGDIRFVVRDDAGGGGTARYYDVTLGLSHYARLTVPPGLWVAFRGVHPAPSLLLNVIDEEHDPAEAENAELSKFEYSW